MRKILLVGNPNVGKTTLFNSLTKSMEHTGNFHGVTVEEKSKIIRFENEEYEIVDLPGLYSLNSFSEEEEVAKNLLLQNDCQILVLVDANSIRKNLYLIQQLNEIGINYKILINNYKFSKKNNLKINFNLLQNNLNKEVYVINAKKFKINKEILKNEEKTNKNSKKPYKYLENYIKIIKNKYDLDEKTIILAFNGIFVNLNQEQINYIKLLYSDIIKERYEYIDSILLNCVNIEKNFVYGQSKLDKVILNPFFAFIGFLSTFLVGFYLIFFLIGPWISSIEESLLKYIFVNPIMNLIYLSTDNIWIIEFVRNGVLSSVLTVISFLPQVALLFIFLSLLEESGVIARLAFVFDDFLNFFGLNGKTFYILLLGLGCNTMGSSVTKNLNQKELKTRTLLINPYVSCLARLPVFVLIASAFFYKNSFLVILGLYFLGLIVALVVSAILSKTILKNKNNNLLLEFPPLRRIELKHVLKIGYSNGKDFVKRVFSIILWVGIIVWILTHTKFNLNYTSNISNSILFFFAEKISFLFSPIGLNNAGVVCALIVGVLAKELIVSIFAVCNNVQSQKLLIASLILPTSVINFTIESAISFLIFALLYSSCASNLAVIKKESGSFIMWFSILSQFTIAYMTSFIVYQTLTKGLLFALVIAIIVLLILIAFFQIRNQFENKCNGKCFGCKYNKKS